MDQRFPMLAGTLPVQAQVAVDLRQVLGVERDERVGVYQLFLVMPNLRTG